MADDANKPKQERTIAEKLKEVIDPDSAMGSGKSVRRTGETEARLTYDKNNAIYSSDKKTVLGHVARLANGKFEGYTTKGRIDRQYSTREEALKAVQAAIDSGH